MDSDILGMAKSTTGSDVGTGGMATKLTAAKIATLSGTDMIIANGADVCVLHHIFDDSFRGTIFKAQKKETFQYSGFYIRNNRIEKIYVNNKFFHTQEWRFL